MTDRIVIENRRGCGCGSTLAFLLLAGLAINYWYVALPTAVVLAAGGLWWTMRHPEPVGTYECVRCHADVNKGQVVCPMCNYDVRTAP